MMDRILRSDRSLRFILTTAFFLSLFFAGTAHLTAQDFRNNFYVHQFWAELEATPGGPLAFSGPNVQSPGAPSPGGNAGTGSPSTGGASKAPPTPYAAAITDILKEAQWVYSGMIYGFSFSYTPADPARQIAGSFDLTPIAEIKWGDPNLKVLNTRVEGSRLIARVLYTLVPFQERWTKGWDSNVYPNATGRGSSRYYLSYEEKMLSYKDAIKEAIRDYLRQRIYNRPRKVTGQLVLRGNPYTIIDAGRYITTLTVKLRIGKVEPYRIF